MNAARDRRAGLVILDRDGVISRDDTICGKGYAPRRFSRFHLLPGARDAIARLRRAGYIVVVATNQPDIGNGLVDPREIAAMHAKLLASTRIDAIFVCPHRQDEGCDCRKPAPGMLTAAILGMGIPARGAWMVGDRDSDIAAGHAAGCRTVFIRRSGHAAARVKSDAIVRSLPAAVRTILARPRNRSTAAR